MTVLRSPSRFAIAGIVLAAALSACTANSTDTADTTAPPAASGAAAESAPGSPAETSPAPRTDVVVTVTDMRFSPSTVRIKAGQTVTWKFQDGGVPHQVTGMRDNALTLNSVILKEGEYSHTFNAPGTYDYICSLHPEMTGTVEVS